MHDISSVGFMQVIAPKAAEVLESKCPPRGRHTRSARLAAAIPILVPVALGVASAWVWLAFDGSPPDMDEAGHIMNGLSYADLLRRPHFWQADWIQRFLSVNYFYPPALYIFVGTLKLLFGAGRWVDIATLLFFNAVLTASVYGITVRLSSSRAAAFLAALIVGLYPGLAFVSHQFLLDFPLVAIVAAAIYAVVRWQQRMTYLNAAICGLAVGLAALSKQIGAAYMVGPLLVVFVCSLLSAEKAMRRHIMAQTALIGVIAAGLFAPWFVSNYTSMSAYARNASAEMGNPSLWTGFWQNFGFYCQGAIHTLSPLLAAVLLAGIVLLPASKHRSLALVGASAAGGVLLTCLITCTAPLDRYLVPATIAAAIYSGVALSILLKKGALIRLAVLALLAVACVQFISFEYTPYPISGAPLLQDFANGMGVSVRAYRSTALLDNPAPVRDWGHDWILNTVEKYDGKVPVWLNVMANMSELNAHSFELLVKERKSTVRPTTSRVWTLKGDDVSFAPEKALYYHWFVIKTGDCGNRLVSAKAEAENARLLDFVRTSGKFKLVDERGMPDGTRAFLYRQIGPTSGQP